LGNAVAGATLAMAGSSMGTVYTRPITGGVTMEESLSVPRIYARSGTLESSQFDAQGAARWLGLSWEAELPVGTRADLALATRDEGGQWSPWHSLAVLTSGGAGQVDLDGLVASSRYVRYRATLWSSADHRSTPRLLEIALDYELLPATSTPARTVTPSPTATAIPSPAATSTASPLPMPGQYLPLVGRSE